MITFDQRLLCKDICIEMITFDQRLACKDMYMDIVQWELASDNLHVSFFNRLVLLREQELHES